MHPDSDPDLEDYGPDFMPSEDYIRATGALWHPTDNPDPAPARASVEALLARVANHDQDDDTYYFMVELARCLLAAGGHRSGSEPKDRPKNVLKAVGLAGKYHDDRKLAAFMADTQHFGDAESPTIVHTPRERAKAWFEAGNMPHAKDQKEIALNTLMAMEKRRKKKS